MVLGQCMETLRANQCTLARSLAAGAGATEQVVVGWVGDLYRQLPPGGAEPGTPALSASDIHVSSPSVSSPNTNVNVNVNAQGSGEQLEPEAGADAHAQASLASRGYAKLPKNQVREEEKEALERAIEGYVPPEEYPKDSEAKERKNVSFVPVWLEDDVAHGHYDGYCKTSTCLFILLNTHIVDITYIHSN